MLIYANNIKFDNTPVADTIRSYINLPVFIENDANCAALAESVSGAAKGCSHSITITLGTGLGGGVIIGNRILNGAFYGGGELGHHVIVIDGDKCTCGRKGCWEAYASATGLIRQTKRAAKADPKTKILDLVDGDINKIEAKTVFDARDLGDETAEAVIAQYVRYVAEGLTNMINIFEPEVIAMGGGVCAQGEKFVEPLRDAVQNLAYGGKIKTKILAATLGNEAGIIGAAMLSKLRNH